MKPESRNLYWLLFIVCLLSCNNKEQQRLEESAKRLEQQNDIGRSGNWRLERRLSQMVSEDYLAYEYLQQPVTYFNENAQRFASLVSDAMRPADTINKTAIYNQYQALQQGYIHLRQRIRDSFSRADLDTNINAFMNLDKKTFIQKYLSEQDSSELKLNLLFLQADAAVNETFLLEGIVDILTPTWNFNTVWAIGTTDQQVYKRGQLLKLSVGFVQNTHARILYAHIEGKQIVCDKNEFEYTKKITEQPGLHEIRFQVYARKNGKLETYPAVATYRVK